jgi:glycosyltransferase involved in cell wall biosynthesis
MMQDFTDYELIISDDTPDDSVETFIRSTFKDQPYSYTRNDPSAGTPQNWNVALSKAKGKYIKILHHDDFFTQKDSLRLMVEAIEKSKSDFLYCDTDVWFVNSDAHKINFTNPKQFVLINDRPAFLFFKNLIGAPSATLYLNDVSMQFDVRFKWLVDIEFYIRFLKKHGKLNYLNKALVCTCHGSSEQVTTSVENDRVIQIREHIRLYNLVKDSGFDFALYFDYLFSKYSLQSMKELKEIVPEAEENRIFFEKVISSLSKGRWYKDLKKRLYGSRYNYYLLKLEQFL